MTDCALGFHNRKQRRPQCCTLRGAKRLLKRNIILKRQEYHFADASKMIVSRKYPRYCIEISEISKSKAKQARIKGKSMKYYNNKKPGIIDLLAKIPSL